MKQTSVFILSRKIECQITCDHIILNPTALQCSTVPCSGLPRSPGFRTFCAIVLSNVAISVHPLSYFLFIVRLTPLNYIRAFLCTVYLIVFYIVLIKAAAFQVGIWTAWLIVCLFYTWVRDHLLLWGTSVCVSFILFRLTECSNNKNRHPCETVCHMRRWSITDSATVSVMLEIYSPGSPQGSHHQSVSTCDIDTDVKKLG